MLSAIRFYKATSETRVEVNLCVTPVPSSNFQGVGQGEHESIVYAIVVLGFTTETFHPIQARTNDLM